MIPRRQRLALLLALASVDPARGEEALARRFSTIQSVALHQGITDVRDTPIHRLLFWVFYPETPLMGPGRVDHLKAVRGMPAHGGTLFYVHSIESQIPEGLEDRRVPELTVDGDRVRLKGRRVSPQVGKVGPDMKVTMISSVTEDYPAGLVYLPALDGVFQEPWTLPRITVEHVENRRLLNRSGLLRFPMVSGGERSFEFELVGRPDTDDRLLVLGHGEASWVVGVLTPFSSPTSWRMEKPDYEGRVEPNRRLEFALYNELGPVERLEAPLPSDRPYVVYGLKIHPEYFAGFDPRRGPVLKGLGGLISGKKDHEDHVR